MKASALLFALLVALPSLSGGPARAALGVVQEGPAVQTGATSLVLHSDRTGSDYSVVVTPPGVPVSLPGQSFPTVYALDGGYGVAAPTARLLGNIAAIDAVYVVAIDYPPEQAAQRDRDFLHHPSQRNGRPIGGGGEAFQAFLLEELRPFLEARFPLDPRRSVLFGHSLGGLFTANLLAERPGAFSAYVIASPSANYDPEVSARVGQSARQGEPRLVYLAAGGAESEGIRERVKRLSEALAQAGSKVRVETRIFEGEGHVNYYPLLVPAALIRVIGRSTPVPVQNAVSIEPAILSPYPGTYRLSDGKTLVVTRVADKLTGEMTGLPRGELIAEGPDRFFMRGIDFWVKFEGPDKRVSPALIVHLNGAEARAIRTS